MKRRFSSKVDWWFYAAIATIPLAIMTPLLVTPGAEGDLVGWGITLVTLALPLWLLFSTHYTITDTQLLIRSGPFRWAVSLETIKQVEPSRSMISFPALSLDRLRIDYGNQQSILVSPKEKVNFLTAIGQSNE